MALKILVTAFIVTPMYVKINEETGLVCGEGKAPEFAFHPDKPFNIEQTVKDIERLVNGPDTNTNNNS